MAIAGVLFYCSIGVFFGQAASTRPRWFVRVTTGPFFCVLVEPRRISHFGVKPPMYVEGPGNCLSWR